MSELKNCKRCGSVFEVSGFYELCTSCVKRDEEDFSRIRDYLYENPLAKIYDVANVLDIPVKRIKRYLREGRLEIVENSNVFLDCEMCGQPIRSGRYCDDCLSKVSHDFKVVFTSKPSNDIKANFKYLTQIK